MAGQLLKVSDFLVVPNCLISWKNFTILFQTRIYARNTSISNGETDYAAKVTPKLLEFFIRHFSVPYPLTKSGEVKL